MRNDRDILSNAGDANGFTAPRDYRAPDKPTSEPNMLRMGLIAGGIAVFALGGMSLWTWAGHRHGGVPVIEADARAVREKPVDQGGMKVEGANEAILSGNTDSKAVVAPAPESPALAALRGAAVASANPAPAPQMSSLPESKVRVGGLDETPRERLLNASPPASAIAQPPAPKAVAATAVPAKPIAKPATAGAATVQLAALKSQAAATSEWQRLEKRYPALLGGREPAIVSSAHDGKPFWRLRVTGFADKKSAVDFCGKFKAAGGQCTLAAG